MKSLVIALCGLVCFGLGLVGLLVPIFPGFIFLLVSALCFASLSPRVRVRLSRNPRMQRFFARIDASQGLEIRQRIRLGFWAALEAVSRPNRRGRSSLLHPHP